jgi:hypothetical protein
MEYVTAAIVVTLILLGLGIVINGLLRLRKWLNNPPTLREGEEPPERTE